MADVHLLVQTIIYFCIFVCGFAISIPLGVAGIQFDHSCLLFAHFKNGILQSVSSSENCHFPLYMSVVGCILYGLALGCYNAYAYRQSRRDKTTGAQMWVLPFILTNAVITVMVFVAACMISIGFKKFCDGLLKSNALYKHCADAQNTEWHNTSTGRTFKTGKYYYMINVSQIACWIAVLLWIAQLALGLLRFLRNRGVILKGGTVVNQTVINTEPAVN